MRAYCEHGASEELASRDAEAASKPVSRGENAQAVANLTGIAAWFLNEIPDEKNVRKMRTPAFIGALRAVSADEVFDERICEGATMMADYLEDTVRSVEETVTGLGVDRTRVYRGISPSYGPPYPSEAVWRGLDGADAAQFVEQLVEDMRLLGGAPTAGTERPDYLGMELQFARFLLEGVSDEANEGRSAALAEKCAAFCREHLFWVGEFTQAAKPYAKTRFLRGHLLMLEGLCAQLPQLIRGTGAELTP